jgi:glycosyltransferase involved in cell wall biosynthesis
MKIAQVAPLWISIPPKTYGGTELVISWLCDELVKRGHDVYLFASGDSKTKAKLIPVWPSSLWNANLKTPHAVFSLLYQKLIEMQENFDIIHDHCEWYTCTYSKFLKPPL